MRVVERMLFLRYALPCASTFVTRGVISQGYLDNLVKQVSENRLPDENVEDLFKVARAMCTAIAKRMAKDVVDAEVIRQYFLLEHGPVVDERYELMGDFDPVGCKTRAGRVMEVNGAFAQVETSLGRQKYRTDFCRGLAKGDTVSTHYDFIVERISPELAARMNQAGSVHEGRA